MSVLRTGLRSGLNVHVITSVTRTSAARGAEWRAFTSSVVAFKAKYPDDIPKGPKGPVSSFGLYLKQHYNDLKESAASTGEQVSVSSTLGELGDRWKKLAASERESFETAAAEARKAYDEAYKAWYESLDKDTLKRIKEATGLKVRKPGGKAAYNQQRREQGLPMRPLTPYIAWYKDFLATTTEPGSLTDISKRAGQVWKTLPESEKSKYKEKYNEEYAKFKAAGGATGGASGGATE